MTIPEGLLEDVKNYLGITWTDETTDQKISGFVLSGMSYLNGKLGAAVDYMETGAPRTLLMEYVRYARDYALDVFENNYLCYLLDMQNEKAVNVYVESTEPTGE